MTFPVIQWAREEHRDTTASATSSGVVRRPEGFRAVAPSMRRSFPGIFLKAGVSVTPPRSAFTVIPIGAINYAHSSQGPTNDHRIRPDFAANGVLQIGKNRIAGTSYATPRVAGALAQIFAHHPDWTAQEVLSFLRDFSSYESMKEKDNRYGWGAVNFTALIRALSL